MRMGLHRAAHVRAHRSLAFVLAVALLALAFVPEPGQAAPPAADGPGMTVQAVPPWPEVGRAEVYDLGTLTPTIEAELLEGMWTHAFFNVRTAGAAGWDIADNERRGSIDLQPGMPVSRYTLPAGSMQVGDVFEWQVRICGWDDDNACSPWSEVASAMIVGDATPAADVVPIFECAERKGDGTFTAYFGYDNRSGDGDPVDVAIAVGSDNSVVPAGYTELLPELFEVPGVVEGSPGRTAPGGAEPSAFVVGGWDGQSVITWTLLGESVSASLDTLCSDLAPASSSARIQRAYDLGELTAAEAAELHLRSAVDPESLPDEFRAKETDAHTEPAWWWLGEAWDHLTSTELDAIEHLLTPQPVAPVGESCDQSAEWFGEVWDCFESFSADDDVSARSGAGSEVAFNIVWDSNHVEPELVLETAAATRLALATYAGLQYPRPTGFTIAINHRLEWPVFNRIRPFAIPNRIVIPPDWVSPRLVYHEVFHLFQYELHPSTASAWGMINSPVGRWWMEATASWAERKPNGQADDPDSVYAQRLPEFLGTSSQRLDTTSRIPGATRDYGVFILAEYLEQAFGAWAVRVTLEDVAAGAGPLDAIRVRLGDEGLETFWQWAYLIERNALGVGFPTHDPNWRKRLQGHGPTSADDEVRARPARTNVPLLANATADGRTSVAPGGSAFVELDLQPGGQNSAHRVTVEVERTGEHLRLVALPMSGYPNLCAPIQTVSPENGTAQVDLLLPSDCSTVALAFVNTSAPGLLGGGTITSPWRATHSRIPRGQVVLLAGQGDEATTIDRLAARLTAAGYLVETSPTLPANLDPYGQVWWVDWRNPFPATAANRLRDYVAGGGGLYLTGERDACCMTLNNRVSTVTNMIVDGPQVQVGGYGDVAPNTGSHTINPNAAGGLGTTPFTVTELVPSAPGGLGAVYGSNVLASSPLNARPIAGAWDTDDVVGDGRLVVVMDVNWLDAIWEGPQTYQLVQNIALFLSGRDTPPRAPVDPSDDPAGQGVSLMSEPPGERSPAAAPAG